MWHKYVAIDKRHISRIFFFFFFFFFKFPHENICCEYPLEARTHKKKTGCESVSRVGGGGGRREGSGGGGARSDQYPQHMFS